MVLNENQQRAGPHPRSFGRWCRSLNNENLYGFICLLGTTLFANRRGVRRPGAARARHTAGEIGNPDGQKPENKISRRDEKFQANLGWRGALARAREATPKYLEFYDAAPKSIG